jgi:DivIVA domain-containing protein
VSDQNPAFKTVMRGYDPTEVDHHLQELARRTSEITAEIAAERDQLTQQRDGLAARVQELHEAAAASTEPPSYEHLGERVGQILALADTEATELRDRARTEAEAHTTSVHAAAAQVRDEADQYATRIRSEADARAARIEEEARKAADDHRDSAERDASVRLQEAEAVYEEQRARAAKAAADFETTLAGRRKAAEDEFTQKMGESQTRLDEAEQLAERTRTDAEHARVEAQREAARLVEEARQEAARIVGDAKATAERVRSDSDRELAAASQRRDSINAQLANVRQMLATLTGTAAMPLSAFGADDEGDDEREAPGGTDQVEESAAEASDEETGQAGEAAGDEAEDGGDEVAAVTEREESLAGERG